MTRNRIRIGAIGATSLSALALAAVPAPAGAEDIPPKAFVPATGDALQAFVDGDEDARVRAQIQGRRALLGTTESTGVAPSLANALRGLLRGESTEVSENLELALDQLATGERETVVGELTATLNARANGDDAAAEAHLRRALQLLLGNDGRAEPNSTTGSANQLVDDLLLAGDTESDALEDALESLLGYEER